MASVACSSVIAAAGTPASSATAAAISRIDGASSAAALMISPPTGMVASATEHGAATFICDGAARWSAVHVEDLADLVLTVLEGRRDVAHPCASRFVGRGILDSRRDARR
jgi:hypothetical protein